MGYSAGFLQYIIQPLNRKAAQAGDYGIDSGGIEWEEGPRLHANVGWAKGLRSLNAGSVDAYGVKLVRMRFTCAITERSRIKFDGKTYQILPETFNPDRHDDTLQFTMQLIVNE